MSAASGSGPSETRQPSLDSVRFDATGWSYQGEPQPSEVRVWHTPDGDGVGVYFFAVPPNLPRQATSAAALTAFYRRMMAGSSARLLEALPIECGNCAAVRALLAVPESPSGRSYLGSITVPFRNFSFVIKCQCAENGVTGIKEAILQDRRLRSSNFETFDPDAEVYDREFPDHPVARARRILNHVAATLEIAPGTLRLPKFYPSQHPL